MTDKVENQSLSILKGKILPRKVPVIPVHKKRKLIDSEAVKTETQTNTPSLSLSQITKIIDQIIPEVTLLSEPLPIGKIAIPINGTETEERNFFDEKLEKQFFAALGSGNYAEAEITIRVGLNNNYPFIQKPNTTHDIGNLLIKLVDTRQVDKALSLATECLGKNVIYDPSKEKPLITEKIISRCLPKEPMHTAQLAIFAIAVDLRLKEGTIRKILPKLRENIIYHWNNQLCANLALIAATEGKKPVHRSFLPPGDLFANRFYADTIETLGKSELLHLPEENLLEKLVRVHCAIDVAHKVLDEDYKIYNPFVENRNAIDDLLNTNSNLVRKLFAANYFLKHKEYPKQIKTLPSKKEMISVTSDGIHIFNEAIILLNSSLEVLDKVVSSPNIIDVKTANKLIATVNTLGDLAPQSFSETEGLVQNIENTTIKAIERFNPQKEEIREGIKWETLDILCKKLLETGHCKTALLIVQKASNHNIYLHPDTLLKLCTLKAITNNDELQPIAKELTGFIDKAKTFHPPQIEEKITESKLVPIPIAEQIKLDEAVTPAKVEPGFIPIATTLVIPQHEDLIALKTEPKIIPVVIEKPPFKPSGDLLKDLKKLATDKGFYVAKQILEVAIEQNDKSLNNDEIVRLIDHVIEMLNKNKERGGFQDTEAAIDLANAYLERGLHGGKIYRGKEPTTINTITCSGHNSMSGIVRDKTAQLVHKAIKLNYDIPPDIIRGTLIKLAQALSYPEQLTSYGELAISAAGKLDPQDRRNIDLFRVALDKLSRNKLQFPDENYDHLLKRAELTIKLANKVIGKYPINEPPCKDEDKERLNWTVINLQDISNKLYGLSIFFEKGEFTPWIVKRNLTSEIEKMASSTDPTKDFNEITRKLTKEALLLIKKDKNNEHLISEITLCRTLSQFGEMNVPATYHIAEAVTGIVKRLFNSTSPKEDGASEAGTFNSESINVLIQSLLRQNEDDNKNIASEAALEVLHITLENNWLKHLPVQTIKHVYDRTEHLDSDFSDEGLKEKRKSVGLAILQMEKSSSGTNSKRHLRGGTGN